MNSECIFRLRCFHFLWRKPVKGRGAKKEESLSSFEIQIKIGSGGGYQKTILYKGDQEIKEKKCYLIKI